MNGYTYSAFNKIIALDKLAKSWFDLDNNNDYELNLETGEVKNLKTNQCMHLSTKEICDLVNNNPDYEILWNIEVS